MTTITDHVNSSYPSCANQIYVYSNFQKRNLSRAVKRIIKTFMASFMHVWNTGQTEKKVAIHFSTMGNKRVEAIKEFMWKIAMFSLIKLWLLLLLSWKAFLCRTALKQMLNLKCVFVLEKSMHIISMCLKSVMTLGVNLTGTDSCANLSIFLN